MLVKPSDWPCDPVFGDVFSALTPDQVGSALRASVDESWSHCSMIEALYDPGVQVRIAYALSDKPLRPGRAWPDGEVVYLRYPVRRPMSRRGEVFSIDGHELELYRFPNDRRLRGLRRFSKRDHAVNVWQRWLDESEPQLKLQPDTLRRELLRYVPEQKWIVRLSAQCHDAAKNTDEKRTIAIRAADAVQCRTIHDRSRSLRRAVREHDGAFHVPRAMVLDADLGLMATRWAWGDSLLEMLRANDPAAVMDRVATGLGALHRLTIDGLDTMRTADRLASAGECVRDLGAVLPRMQASLDALLVELSRRCPDDHPAHSGTCHNDFHWNQFRGQPDRLTILDLERCAVGDPNVDVATFQIQLAMLPHRPQLGVSKAEASAWSQAFRSAWESQADSGSAAHPRENEARLRWHSAIALLVLARGMMRHLRPGWPDLAGCCLESAMSRLGSSTTEAVL
jgi:aminoglycoside phosphotransferase (APT) family kinase protein